MLTTEMELTREAGKFSGIINESGDDLFRLVIPLYVAFKVKHWQLACGPQAKESVEVQLKYH
jgi:hypothetical protein